MTQSFAHLHLHTQYSILDGAIPIEPLMRHLRANGMEAAAMTDHGNLFGAVDFYEAARAAGVRPILGCEVYVAQTSRFDRDPETGGFNGMNHLILLAENETGWRNLVRLVSRAYLEGFYYKPRIDMELLRAHREGLIATSGCLSGMAPSAILRGRTRDAWEIVESFSKLFPDRYYLELQRHGIPAQDVVNRELLKMHEELRLPLVATNDCHYLHAADAHPHEALLCVQTGRTLDDPKRFRFTGEGFFVKSPREMLEVFADVPQALRSTLEIAERCRFELELGKLELPEFQVPAGETLESHLRRQAWSGLAERLTGDPERPLPADSEPYVRRLQYELDVIARCGYPGYFLIVWDLIRFARERGIPVGPGRGSSAGSLVAWALRIVDVDPVLYQISFERFLNPERVSMPDIDMDFCMNRRSEVVRYVEQKYNGAGPDERRVAGIVTFGTMQPKAAIRDVGRVLGVPYADVDRVAKLVPATLGITLDEALQSSREMRELVERDPKTKEMVELARALEGQIRNPGKHAAGIVISRRPLLEVAPLYRDPRTGDVLTQFDYRAAERTGLVKFDLLGLKTLTILHDAVRRIRASIDAGFSLEAAALDDAPSFDLLCAGDTEAVFQVGQSGGMTDLVMKTRPRHFRDLIPLVALYRPGPLQSGMVDDYVNRRSGRTRVEYLLPALEEALAETYGVIVYQDQVLQIANRLASFTLGEGDLLRRAMGKKIPEEMEAQRARFIAGCERNGHPRGKAEQLFEIIAQFAGYGFPKAHAAAYAVITFQTAYLKAHHPGQFLAATMTAEWREHDKLQRYIRDAGSRGIRMQPPCVNASAADFDVDPDGKAIRFGLAGIKNVGEGAVEAIVEARAQGGPFESLRDFCARVDARRVNRRVVESLVRCGAFDFAGRTRAELWEGLDAAFERGAALARDRAAGQASLFGGATSELERLPREVPEWPSAQRLAGEKEMLGFYVTGHPLQAHADALERFAETSIAELGERHKGRTVRLVGILSELVTRKTRGGNLMAKALLEDLTGTLEVVIFPAVFDKFAELLRTGEPLLVRGQVQLETERPELQLDDAVPLAQAWSAAVRQLRLRIRAPLLDRERLQGLRRLLDLAPGSVPVSLCVELAEGAEARLDLVRHRVAVTQSWVAEIEALFGARVVECG